MAALAAPARPSLLACLPSFGSPRTDVADTRMPPPCVSARKEREYVRAGECTRAHAHTAPRRRPPDRSLAGARARARVWVCLCVFLRMRLYVRAADAARIRAFQALDTGVRAHGRAHSRRTLTPANHARTCPRAEQLSVREL
jgi:hypothetical protein